MKISINTMQKLSKIKNSVYDDIKIEYLYHSNKLEGSTIADFHQKFEHIHPFQDGNGRIGRFIILRQCLETKIDLIAIDDEYNKEYRDSL